MIPIEQAFGHILRSISPSAVTRVPLSEALNCVLAEDVRADRDWPPFHRSAVDGFAVFSSDTRTAPDVLEVIEEVPAGKTPTRVISPGQAVRIMTGAPLPAGADCVIMLERTQPAAASGYVKIMMTMRSGQNVSRRAEDAKAGEAVLKAGLRITPAEIGILAFVGCHQVPVRAKPGIAILASGDELVEAHEQPGAALIRNSNSPQLMAQCAANHFPARYLGIARDNREQTRALLEEGLKADVLITTGGVSVGDHDYIGSTLRELGVNIFFDRVAIKPGKPSTFGMRGETIVFGLPGNPVAALVCFHLFVLTALRQRMGMSDPLPRWISMPLAGNIKGTEERTVFRPANLILKDGESCVEEIDWHGSGHLAALAGASGLVVERPGQPVRDGERVTFYPF